MCADFNKATTAELAEKYRHDHTNPIIKIDLPGPKLFLPQGTTSEQDFVAKSVSTVEQVLRHERVDRRCARSQAVWLPDEKLAKIERIVGPLLATFGYQNSHGKFLWPEEVLYLMENNRLELTTRDNVPISIEQAYAIVLSVCTLTKYRVYKKLVGDGYKLTRQLKSSSGGGDNDDGGVSSTKKRKLEEDDCAKAASVVLEEVKSSKNVEMAAIFERLRANGPQQDDIKSSNLLLASRQPDYYVFSSNNSSSKSKPDYRLFIFSDSSDSASSPDVNEEQLEDRILRLCCFGTSTDIFAVCSDSNIGLYRFCNVNIPNLF